MEEAPHPPDCACCRVEVSRRGAKRTREDADLSTFLPEPEEGLEGGAEEGEEGEEEPPEEEEEEPPEEEAPLIHDALFKSFEAHVEHLDAARLRRIEALSFKSALEDDGEKEINEDATQDEIDGLGVWLPGDEFQGDVNMRTLQKLLTRVDQRGFERSAQQLEARPSRFSLPAPRSSRVCSVRTVPRRVHEGRRTRHLPRIVGDRATGHHEALRLGDEQQRSFDLNSASIRQDVFVRRSYLAVRVHAT